MQARLIERGALRYTPAGLAVAQVKLGYRGVQVEAGVERQLDFELEAVAIGGVAQTLAAVALGTPIDLDGFVSPTRKGSRQLKVHITSYRETSGV